MSSSINESGDTDRDDMIDTEMIMGDSGGEDGVSTPTSKLLSRSLLGLGLRLRPEVERGQCMRRVRSFLDRN